MGISYRADVAYGFMLTEDEMIEIATDRGYESKYYETLQDAIDENDFEYDFAYLLRCTNEVLITLSGLLPFSLPSQ